MMRKSHDNDEREYGDVDVNVLAMFEYAHMNEVFGKKIK